MGYTVSVKFKDQQEKEKMENFINSNQSILDKLSLLDLDMPSRKEASVLSEHLSYAPQKKYLLGFHNTITPEYIWDLCAWMAVKSSVRNKAGEAFFYHDKEAMKITHDVNNNKNTLTDNEGLPIKGDVKDSMLYRISKKQQIPQYKEQNELMTQLNDAWNKLDKKIDKKSKIKP